jgi:hypothetical protein
LDAAGGNVDAGAMFPGCGFVRDLEFEWLELGCGTRIVASNCSVGGDVFEENSLRWSGVVDDILAVLGGQTFEYRLFRKISVKDRFGGRAKDPVGKLWNGSLED